MPLFEFLCKTCKNHFEEFSNIHIGSNGNSLLENQHKCPKCGSYETIKQISSCNFHLKGSGWAKDGYSKK